MQAGKFIYAVNTWSDLHVAFLKFRQCDDGELADAFEDKIVGLLIHQWQSVHELNRLAQKDPEFEAFVIKHLDEEMSPDEASEIMKFAEKSCPINASELCAKIKTRMIATAQ